ncbi:MAG: putative dual-specificity RNA methyltransferase RlmN [Verrucomicrobia subdivision 3 bacterium]|nr:putative dual-specificity RNA methyltransferase RlmN [Limisphaerales bacterium]MCS1413763.1 putative dual-specificity RNA methyltransferase RlmN [Limisphaerales bacterium]
MRENIRSKHRLAIDDWLLRNGHPRYRCGQILHWLYSRRVTDWEAMGNVPKALRQALSEEFEICLPELVRQQEAGDSTRKYLWRLKDGAFIESVLIPANPAQAGVASDRKTLCVSTQVGCAYGCVFCASGLDGWKRNLAPDEIVGQVLAAETQAREETSGGDGAASRSEIERKGGERQVDNLVFMGMGEPLANYDNLLKALSILNADWGVGIGARRITISTSGLVPQIRQLAEEPAQYRLAISLHGPTDEVRRQVMPVSKRHPLAELMEACEYFSQKRGKVITLEYILIEGVNDAVSLADSLSKLAHQLRAKVNLIPYNMVDGLKWRRPSVEQQEQFFRALCDRGVRVTLRRVKGHDIDAACGQLRLKAERRKASETAV